MNDGTAAAFETKLQSSWPLDRWRDLTVLVAVSGGADSVALLRGLHSLYRANPGEGRLVVAHFNHGLRGTASDADEQFVCRLAERSDLEFTIGRAASEMSATAGDGLEAAARQARYGFFSTTARECGARYIATAHTADDQVETVLFNILRGTGLTGLAGIPRMRLLDESATLIRPLLSFRRGEIIEYLAAIKQSFRDDETNQLTDYTRNRIRHELLPMLERQYNPAVRDALLRLAQIGAQADEYLDREAEALVGTNAKYIANGFELKLEGLENLHPALLRQMLAVAWRHQRWSLQNMSFEKWQRLVEWCCSRRSPGVEIFPGGVRAELTTESLRLTMPS